MKLNALALGYAAAVLSALCMLVMSLLAYFGLYVIAVQLMMSWHMFASWSLLGVLAGAIESAVWGFVLGYVFGWLYNMFAKK